MRNLLRDVAFHLAACALLASGQSSLYGQCGGIGWTGATTCVSGSTCTVLNAYYYQCLPGSASSTSSATSTKPTTSTTTTTTTLTTPTTTSSVTTTSTSSTAAPTGTASSFTILSGGYDVFIATYNFNPNTNTLSLVTKSPSGTDPSWIALHPTNQSILYATNEVGPGALQSFDINSSGGLSPAVQTVSSGGDNPAFCTPLSNGSVAILNYNTGNARIIPTTSSPEDFSSSAPTITFPIGPSGASHPHMALEYNGEVLISDLGGDMIWRLGQSGSPGNYIIHGSIPQPQGSGPRHIAIYDERLFVLHELSSTLTVQAIPTAPNGTSSIIASASIIPPNPPAGAAFAGGEILIPAPTSNFPTPYIYVSNRNTGTQDPRGDTIAIFEHVNQGASNEGLQLVAQVYTGLDQIRGMQFGPAVNGGEQYLIASGVAGSAGVIVLQRTSGGSSLQIVASNLAVPTRSSFVWL